MSVKLEATFHLELHIRLDGDILISTHA